MRTVGGRRVGHGRRTDGPCVRGESAVTCLNAVALIGLFLYAVVVAGIVDLLTV
jgi:hypothetical protein